MNKFQERLRSSIPSETKEERPRQTEEKPERSQNTAAAEEEKPPRTQNGVLAEEEKPPRIQDAVLPKDGKQSHPSSQVIMDFALNEPQSLPPYLLESELPTKNESIDEINKLQNIIPDFQGPLQFTKWTFNIQTVIWLILKGEPSLKFYANEKGELMAAWNESKENKEVNITESLENHVIFDQIILYSADFTDYLNFLASKSIMAKEVWKREYLFQKSITSLEILEKDAPIPGGENAAKDPRVIYVREDQTTGKFFAWWFDYPNFEKHPIDDEYQDEFKNKYGRIVYRDDDEKIFESLILKCGYKDNLHTSEKIDINIYSEEYFKIINNFLREFGRSTALIYQKYKEDPFQTIVKDILCLTVFAAKGLIKIPSEQGWFYREMVTKGETEKFFDDIKKATEENSASSRPSKTIKDAFISTSHPDSKEIFEAKDANFFQLIWGEAPSIKKYAAYSKEDEYLMTPYAEFIHFSLLKINNNYFLLSKQVLGPSTSYDKEENVTGDDYFKQALEDHEPQRIVEFNPEKYYFFNQDVKITDPRYNIQVVIQPTGLSLIKDYYARKYDTEILFFPTLSFDVIPKKIIPLLREEYKKNNKEELRKGIVLDFGLHRIPVVYFRKNNEEGILITDSASADGWKYALQLHFMQQAVKQAQINFYFTQNTRQASGNSCSVDAMVIAKDATAICKITGQYRIPDLFSRIKSRIKPISPFLFSVSLPNELLKTTQISAYYENNKESDDKWIGASKISTPSEFRQKHTYTEVLMQGNKIKNISSFLHEKEYDYADKCEILFYWNFISQTWGNRCDPTTEKTFVTKAKKHLKEQGPAKSGNYSGLCFFPNGRPVLYSFSKSFVSSLLNP